MQWASLTLDWTRRERAVKTRQGQMKKTGREYDWLYYKSHNSMTFAETDNCTVFT